MCQCTLKIDDEMAQKGSMDDKASKIKKKRGVQEERRTIREKHGEEKLEEFLTKQMKFYKKLKNRLDKYFWHY